MENMKVDLDAFINRRPPVKEKPRMKGKVGLYFPGDVFSLAASCPKLENPRELHTGLM